MATAKISNIQVKVPTEIKREAEDVFKSMGLDMTSGIRVYLNSVIRHQGIPFAVTARTGKENSISSIPVDDVTQAKMDEVEKVWAAKKKGA